MTLFRFNHYGLTKNKFSSDIVLALSKRNRFSIGHCAKFVGHARCPTAISHPEGGYKLNRYIRRSGFIDEFSKVLAFKKIQAVVLCLVFNSVNGLIE